MKPSPLAVVPLLAILGCGADDRAPGPQQKRAPAIMGATARSAPPPAAAPAPAGQPPAPQTADAPVERKIIYNAEVDLLVPDLTKAAAALKDLVRKHQCLVAQSDTSSNPGGPSSGRWRVRVPADQLDGFLDGLARLGEAVTNKRDSEDVTDSYFDHQVRIENKKVQVERLQKIIREQTGKISELLQAERELARVTMELEGLKGKVKLWDNQVALATVNLTIRERPPVIARKEAPPPEAPSFGKQLRATFFGSLDALVSFGQGLVLLAAALVPWLPVAALIVIPPWLAVRRYRRRGGLPVVDALAADPVPPAAGPA